jgi:hypothetical protein
VEDREAVDVVNTDVAKSSKGSMTSSGPTWVVAEATLAASSGSRFFG